MHPFQDYIDAHHDFHAAARDFYAAFPHDASDLAARVLLGVTSDPGAARRFVAFLGLDGGGRADIRSPSDRARPIRRDVSADAEAVPAETGRIDGIVAHLRRLEAGVDDADPKVGTGIWAARIDLLAAHTVLHRIWADGTEFRWGKDPAAAVAA